MRYAWFTALLSLFLTARTCTGSWSKAITSVNFSKTADALCILDAVWRNTSDGRPHQDVQEFETGFLNSLLPDVLDKIERDRVESAGNAITPNIVGGYKAPVGRFPYMCSIRSRGNRQHMCGGTLIRSKWVLTAARCLSRDLQTDGGNVVCCGIHKRFACDGDNLFIAKKVFKHHYWTGNVLDGFDVGLIKLDKKAKFKRPLIAEKSIGVARGTFLTATGWGITEKGKPSSVLRNADKLVYISRKECQRMLRESPDGDKDITIKDHMICAGGLYEMDICQGDPGGPLLLADSYLGFVADGDPELDSLIGIASFGSENCNAELPAVYMNVTFFWSWVSGAIAGKVVSKIPEPELEDEIRIEIEDMIQPTKAEREPVKETPHVVILEGTREDMIEAIEEDDDDKAKRLLEDDFSVNTIFDPMDEDVVLLLSKHSSLLHWAVALNALECLKALLDYGADVNLLSDDGRTALNLASATGNVDAVKVLVENAADPNTADSEGNTPLHWAAYRGDLSSAEVLVEIGVDETMKNTNGKSPAEICCQSEQASCDEATKTALEKLLSPDG